MTTRTPHVHAELIKAWVDGAEIQVWYSITKDWYDVPEGGGISWSPFSKYRVKPEPKPDTVLIRYASCYDKTKIALFSEAPTTRAPKVEFTFDGETHELKSVRMI